jgi:hypothetical protein
MMEETWIRWIKNKFLLPESNEVDHVIKTSETVCASSESDRSPTLVHHVPQKLNSLLALSV